MTPHIVHEQTGRLPANLCFSHGELNQTQKGHNSVYNCVQKRSSHMQFNIHMQINLEIIHSHLEAENMYLTLCFCHYLHLHVHYDCVQY